VDSYLKKSYPKEESNNPYTLARPGLHGDYLNEPTRAFLTGLMLLSGLILLAACLRHGPPTVLAKWRLAPGSWFEPQLHFAPVVHRIRAAFLAGGVAGLTASILLLRRVSLWQPFPRFPLHVPVRSDANVLFSSFGLGVAQRSSISELFPCARFSGPILSPMIRRAQIVHRLVINGIA
jgi:hypothetical protein